ncbi:MAG: DUF6599 family protein [Pyrinomonadaceae bacterium]
MRISFLSRLLLSFVLFALAADTAAAQGAPRNASKVLPDQVGDFRAQGAAVTPPGFIGGARREDYGVTYDGHRTYISATGEKLVASVVQTESESAAYSFFTFFNSARPQAVKFGDIGTASVATSSEVCFVKGTTFVFVNSSDAGELSPQLFTDFGRAFAATLEGGENGLPTLVLHLPEWEKARVTTGYAVTLPALQRASGNRPALDAVSFEGGAEAATADYGGARLVVVEFTTPQHAFDADAAITRRIAELSAAGQPVPSSYKRVGNYSVFVFDAPDAASAEKLISGVKYEKDVRWLGRNPHAEENAIRSYTNTMGGVIMTTLITTGLAILLCLTVGGVIGGAIFLSRRARHTAQEIYSDAGGMLRLNIEDVNTPQTPKMLGRVED